MSTQRERDAILLQDIADLQEMRHLNAKLNEKIHRLETALQVSCHDADNLRAEIATMGIRHDAEMATAGERYDTLHEKYTELRIKMEAILQQAADEFERMKQLRSKIVSSAEKAISDAKPYLDDGSMLPLPRLEVN